MEKSVWEKEQEIGKKNPGFIDPEAWSNDGVLTSEDKARIESENEEIYKEMPWLNPANRKKK